MFFIKSIRNLIPQYGTHFGNGKKGARDKNGWSLNKCRYCLVNFDQRFAMVPMGCETAHTQGSGLMQCDEGRGNFS